MSNRDTFKTAVIFRKWRQGGIIALFPAVPGDSSFATCGSYMHVGQHGTADYNFVMAKTVVAKPNEYKDLLEELEDIGYNLQVYRRITPLHNQLRYAALHS